MRKFLLPVAMLTLSLCAFSQQKGGDNPSEKGFYIKGGGSYFFKVTPVEFPNVGTLQPRISKSYIDAATQAPVEYYEEAITGSFGQGFRVEIVPGYKFNKYFGIEVGIHYYQSVSQQMTDKVVYGPDKTTVLFDLDAKGDVNAFDIAPNLVFNLPLASKFQPYARVGFILPVHGRLRIKSDIVDVPGNTLDPSGKLAKIKIHREEDIKPRPTIGFQSALGTSYYISKNQKWAVYLEAEYRNISVSGKSKTVNVYDGTATAKGNGQTVNLTVDQLTTAQKETQYETSINPSATQDPNQPSKDLRSYINIGGLGINAGIRYNF